MTTHTPATSFGHPSSGKCRRTSTESAKTSDSNNSDSCSSLSMSSSFADVLEQVRARNTDATRGEGGRANTPSSNERESKVTLRSTSESKSVRWSDGAERSEGDPPFPLHSPVATQRSKPTKSHAFADIAALPTESRPAGAASILETNALPVEPKPNCTRNLLKMTSLPVRSVRFDDEVSVDSDASDVAETYEYGWLPWPQEDYEDYGIGYIGEELLEPFGQPPFDDGDGSFLPWPDAQKDDEGSSASAILRSEDEFVPWPNDLRNDRARAA